MNNKLINIAMFAAGAAIGSVVTWKLIKTKYEQITQEEIESMREYYEDKYEGESESKKLVEIGEAASKGIAEGLKKQTVPDNPDLMEYAAKIAKEHGYTIYSNSEERAEEREDKEEMVNEPYVISPDDFGETDYETVTLTLYADGVLADDMDNVIEDPDFLVGDDIESHFGEYEDDTVFVRNDDQQTDYEICRDERNFSDVVQ